MLLSGIIFQNAFAHGNLDQTITSCPCADIITLPGLISPTNEVTRFQDFIPSHNNIISIDIEITQVTNPSANPLLINLRSGGPTGPIIGSTTSHTGLPIGQGIVHFDFAEPIELIPGDTYTIQLVANGATTLRWHGNFGNPYPSGLSWVDTNTSPLASTGNVDFTLKTYSQSIDNVQVIGGKILQIENTGLLLASTQTFTWILPIVVSIIGIGLIFVKRK